MLVLPEMNCPKCQAPTRVLNTREQTRRQRQCKGVNRHRFYTEEVTEEELQTLRHKLFLLQEIGRLFREGMK